MKEPKPQPDDDPGVQAGAERRFTPLDIRPVKVETRADGTKKIVGMAAIYYDGTPRTEYELWPGVKERLRHGAFSALLKDGTDTRALFNHDMNVLLGRTINDTLKLKSTRYGLEYTILPPDTQAAHDVVALLERGDLSGSSFSFNIAPGGEKWSEEEDGTEIREITVVSKLYDVGPVTFPAYEATTADTRSLDSYRAARAEATAAQTIEEQKQQEAKKDEDEQRRTKRPFTDSLEE